MKLKLLLLPFMVVFTQAGDLTITIRNDAGQVVSTTVLQTNNTVIQALNQWRLGQIVTPAIPEHKDAQGNTIPAVPAVLLYPTISDFWKARLKDIILPVLTDYNDAIVAQRAKIDAANAAIKVLQDTAVQ
jgi:hypothetical protein